MPTGVPDPEVTWTFKNKDQAHEVNVRVHNKENYTEIELSDMQRAQTGLYTVHAKNKNGEDSVTVEITVLSAPSKPSNLVVSDVTKNGCHLSFDSPLDNGGTPITSYECDKLDVATGKWVPCAKSATPEFDIKGLIEGHQYRFR